MVPQGMQIPSAQESRMRTLRTFGARGPAAILAALTLTLALAAPTAAQQTGSVTGLVTSSESLRPISGAQVVLGDLEVGGLTNAQGRYLIQNVPAGEHEITVQIIGFDEARQSVSVQPGGVAELNFQLQEIALDLEEIIVTGTPGATRRRAIGTSVASVDVENTLRDAAITSVQDLLSGREAGMSTIASSGLAGGGGNIALGGLASLWAAIRALH